MQLKRANAQWDEYISPPVKVRNIDWKEQTKILKENILGVNNKSKWKRLRSLNRASY